MKELTATRSILFVVAEYSTLSACSSSPPPPICVFLTVESVRRTRGESSLSTWMAWRAVEARRAVGKGIVRTLWFASGISRVWKKGEGLDHYNEQGNSCDAMAADLSLSVSKLGIRFSDVGGHFVTAVAIQWWGEGHVGREEASSPVLSHARKRENGRKTGDYLFLLFTGLAPTPLPVCLDMFYVCACARAFESGTVLYHVARAVPGQNITVTVVTVRLT